LIFFGEHIKRYPTFKMVNPLIHNLFRPSIKHICVKFYENGKEKGINEFDEFRHKILCHAVDAIWFTDEKSPYWFETDVFEYRRCFKDVKTTMEVTCYMADKRNPLNKIKAEIPSRYRKKMFDKRHTIHPELFSGIIWPKLIEVRFVATEKV
jgi:hypothetical protein